MVVKACGVPQSREGRRRSNKVLEPVSRISHITFHKFNMCIRFPGSHAAGFRIVPPTSFLVLTRERKFVERCRGRIHLESRVHEDRNERERGKKWK